MKEPADNNNDKAPIRTKSSNKMIRKKSRISLPCFEVSPHTERIINENKRLICVYTKHKS
ncbi:type II toxin-antitoxin system SpoIISB family antitoxin [Cytobacillus oceanisediminis]|uniref:Antitoxin SpoIISB of type II toxin-antitoxin system n=1 Tax=Cytobacillus oceanisediminis TaxID=665099 RepID=A0A562K591_9BACI|nr:type II toxin-antitoxin system SpoIISB family antitoxin [Cytobacillus oceanisediminis]TWH90589.1 antitoxin SpoIISB of type II toxin-antitoxin system [Cytobacillus oceanisediminis]